MTHRFWYLYASTPKNAFLLDFILRPDRAEVRLLVFSRHEHRVLRATRPVESLRFGKGDDSVACEGLALTPTSCRGRIDEIHLDLSFQLNSSARLVPRWLVRLVGTTPDLVSRYGTLLDGQCQDVAYRELPFVYSTYTVRSLEKSVWLLVSALEFPESDLSIELCATRWCGRWLASAYCRYRGLSYEAYGIRSALTRIRVVEVIEPGTGESRVRARIDLPELRIEIAATARDSEFALLEREGSTNIHTTLDATCEVRVTNGSGHGESHVAARTCLMEFKSSADPDQK